MAHEQSARVAIVGCGPAGIAAAIQLKRSGVGCSVFERERVGGLLANANLVENYPGFPDGISGADLVRLMERHLKTHSIDVIPGEVSEIDLAEDSFVIAARDGVFRSGITILATGTKPKSPDGVKIHAAARPMVLYEIVPIIQIHDKDVVVVGAGDAAFDYALNLGKRNHVTILNRTDHTRCLGILRERARTMASIEYLDNTEVVDVTPASQELVSIGCRLQGRDKVLTAHHLVFAIGRTPELGLLSGSLRQSQERLREDGLLYLIGDVKRGGRRQTAIAVGDGVEAAMEISDKLRMRAR
jgi:thioredoxin reductase (NADPH)